MIKLKTINILIVKKKIIKLKKIYLTYIGLLRFLITTRKQRIQENNIVNNK